MGNRLEVHCRPARDEDTTDVLELTRTIWDGEDYVPDLWKDWLAEAQGMLAVAEYAGRVLGLGKLSRLSDEDWWLMGLRVHPEYEGHGIASQLTEHLMDHWLQTGGGVIRLSTASTNFPIHHLCERLGFVKVGEFTPFVAPAIAGESSLAGFQSLSEAEAAVGIAFALHSSSLALSFGLMDLVWQWAPPRLPYLLEAVRNRQAWWWRGREGLLAIRIDEDEKRGNTPVIQLVACSVEKLGQCLIDYRRLAATLGYARAAWFPPLVAELAPILEQASFQRDWEHAMVVYARKHPG